MTNNVIIVACTGAATLAFAGCTVEEGPRDLAAVSSELVSVAADGGVGCTELLAGQTIPAGEVCVEVESGDLVVTYTTENEWELIETHLWAGSTLADMPQARNGNPKIGNFPYKSGDISGATIHVFRLPLTDFGLTGSETSCDRTTVFLAAHAAVRKLDGSGGYQTETGWGDGSNIVERGTWATFFSVELACEDDGSGPGDGGCETAFARDDNGSATCFLDMDFDGNGSNDFNRWGWSNGGLAAGSYNFEIYAGAGRCSLTAGALVGHLLVDYDDVSGTAVVTFQMTADYTMEETHLYVGSDPLARNVNGEYTVAPGQYPDIHDLADVTSDAYTISGLSGNIYVVAHAVTCGF